MAALLVLRAVVAVLLLRGAPEGTPAAGGDPEDGEDLGFLSGDASATDHRPRAAASPTRPPRRSLWPGWAKVLAAGVPFAGVLLGAAALGLALWRAADPGSVPVFLDADSTVLALVLIALSILAVWILWRVPQWQAAAWAEQSNATPRERFEIENASRGTLGQILSGVAVLAGLIFAWQQLGSTTRSVQLSEQGQLTDRFSSAIGQLASDDLAVRLGGIYALEQIARDNPRDFAAAMQVLAAIVRGDDGTGATTGPLPQDVVVAMTVIGRRTPEQVALQAEQGTPCLDLRGAPLAGLAMATGANLRALCLDGADLSGSTLIGADFSGSSMTRTNLERARLDLAVMPVDLTEADLDFTLMSGARLDGARLVSTSLASAFFVCTSDPAAPRCASLRDASLYLADAAGASFTGTDLTGADFTQTDLANAVFSATDLSATTGLTADQLATAFVAPGVPLPPLPAASPVLPATPARS